MTLVIFWIVSIVVATMIGNQKGKGGVGFILGLFLSWLGVIIVLAMKQEEDKEKS